MVLARFPLLAEEGWMRRSEAKAQTGWSDRRNVWAELTTPAFGHPSSARRGSSLGKSVLAAYYRSVMHPEHVAIVGAGAVGCYFGGMLARAGIPVTLIGRAHHIEAIRRDGLYLERKDFQEFVRLGAETEISTVGGASGAPGASGASGAPGASIV